MMAALLNVHSMIKEISELTPSLFTYERNSVRLGGVAKCKEVPEKD